MEILIIGGSDAGISAALRIKELSPQTKATVILADSYPNFSVCGLPFYLSGEVTDWHNLAHRTAGDIEAAGITLMMNTIATKIDAANKQVMVSNTSGIKQLLSYDRLIIGTGAVPLPPQIEGIDLPGVFVLRTMDDSFKVEQHLQTVKAHSALIVGGGYIGLEMADALVLRGLDVTLVEHGAVVLKTVDAALGLMVQAELERHGVKIVGNTRIEGISPGKSGLQVVGTAGFNHSCDLVIVATGVKPATALAVEAGIVLGEGKAIQVNRQMQTSLLDVFAAGDCVETWHRLAQKPVYLPLGTTAHKQGRIAGENALGGNRQFEGTLGTQVVKIFELAVARTGLREEEARAFGFDPLTVEFKVWDHKAYYPGAHQLYFKITGDRQTGRLLGAQMAGHWKSEVAKRIDIFATALYHNMLVEDVEWLDLSYTPPLASPWDAVQMSTQAWVCAWRTQMAVKTQV